MMRVRQKGVALVTALLIVALTTVMAVSLAARQYMDVRRTGNIMLADQAYLYNLALESFASQLLKTYRENQEQRFDDLQQFQQAMLLFQMIPVEGGSVSATVEFPEAKFNVNTLIDKEGKVKEWERDYYSRLLTHVLQSLGMSLAIKEELQDSLLDWLDPDEEARLAGAEDNTYEGKEIPYKTANRMMSSISEIRLVEGYSREILDGIPADPVNEVEAVPGLLHYITALPDRDSTININLIDRADPNNAKLFLAMASHMDDQIVTELMDSQPFESPDKLTSHKVFDDMKNNQPGNWGGTNGMEKQLNALKSKIDVQSSYFLLKGLATVGDSKINLNSLIYVNTSGTKLEIVSRAIGTPGI